MDSDNNDFNEKCNNIQKKMKKSSKNIETELQGKENDIPTQDETNDDGFIFVQSKKHQKNTNAEDGPMNNRKSNNRRLLRPAKCEEGFIPQGQRGRLDFPKDTDVASKYRWL